MQFHRELEQSFERRSNSIIILPFQGLQRRSPIARILVHDFTSTLAYLASTATWFSHTHPAFSHASFMWTSLSSTHLLLGSVQGETASVQHTSGKSAGSCLTMASTVEFRSIAKVVALVTGGASGLGRATAARLAAQVSTLIPVHVVTHPHVATRWSTRYKDQTP